MKKGEYHEPVLVREIIEALHIKNQAQIIDATLGTGGHTLALIKEGANVLGIEADPEIYEIAKKRLEEACPPFNSSIKGSYTLSFGNFRNIDSIATKNGFEIVDGVLFDLGVSNIQLTSDTRGFSFSNSEAELDVRIDPTDQALKGKDLLNALREDQLVDLFVKVMRNLDSRYLARKIVEQRGFKPFETVGDFLEAIKGLKTKKRLHPGTLPFLALRMAVNSELENIKEALPKAFDLLKEGGRLLTISFHSLERNLVVNFLMKTAREKKGRIVTIDPIVPKQDEIDRNPRARSAELRIIEKK